MSNVIQHKRNSTPGVIPAATGIQQGELAINIGDGKFYTKNASDNIINLGITSISGTYITPSSGNFSTGLTVNGVDVSLSGHMHTSVQQAQSLVTNVFNKTGSTIPKFSAVYINGGQGDQPTIQLAIANGESGSSKTYGLTAEAISDMSTGNVIVAGALTGVNTDQFNPTAPTGDVNGVALWLSPSASGAVTTTKPSAPNHTVFIGNIVRTHQNAGVVEVKIQNGFELQELHNVALNGTSDGQFLQYNYGSGLWVASSSGNFSTLQVNGTGVSVSGHLHTSSNISDFNTAVSGLLTPYQLSLTNPVTGTGISNHVAYWNSTSGIVADSGQLYWDSTNNRLGIGTTSPAKLVHVSGSISTQGEILRIQNSLSSTNTYLDIGVGTVGNYDDHVIFYRGTGTGSNTRIFGIDNNNRLLGFVNWAMLGNTTITSYNNANSLIKMQNLTTNDMEISAVSGIIFQSQMSTKMRMDQNGNLGIGTTSPSSKLDVNGNVNIDGNLTFDSYTESVVAIGNSSTSQTLDLASGTVQTCTLTGNCTFTMPTATAGKSFTLFLNTGTGGYSATFTGVRWSDSTAPTITSTANKVDLLSFISDGSYWYGSFSQNYG